MRLTFRWTPCLPAGSMRRTCGGTGRRGGGRGSRRRRSFRTKCPTEPKSPEPKNGREKKTKNQKYEIKQEAFQFWRIEQLTKQNGWVA